MAQGERSGGSGRDQWHKAEAVERAASAAFRRSQCEPGVTVPCMGTSRAAGGETAGNELVFCRLPTVDDGDGAGGRARSRSRSRSRSRTAPIVIMVDYPRERSAAPSAGRQRHSDRSHSQPQPQSARPPAAGAQQVEPAKTPPSVPPSADKADSDGGKVSAAVPVLADDERAAVVVTRRAKAVRIDDEPRVIAPSEQSLGAAMRSPHDDDHVLYTNQTYDIDEAIDRSPYVTKKMWSESTGTSDYSELSTVASHVPSLCEAAQRQRAARDASLPRHHHDVAPMQRVQRVSLSPVVARGRSPPAAVRQWSSADDVPVPVAAARAPPATREAAAAHTQPADGVYSAKITPTGSDFDQVLRHVLASMTDDHGNEGPREVVIRLPADGGTSSNVEVALQPAGTRSIGSVTPPPSQCTSDGQLTQISAADSIPSYLLVTAKAGNGEDGAAPSPVASKGSGSSLHFGDLSSATCGIGTAAGRRDRLRYGDEPPVVDPCRSISACPHCFKRLRDGHKHRPHMHHELDDEPVEPDVVNVELPAEAAAPSAAPHAHGSGTPPALAGGRRATATQTPHNARQTCSRCGKVPDLCTLGGMASADEACKCGTAAASARPRSGSLADARDLVVYAGVQSPSTAAPAVSDKWGSDPWAKWHLCDGDEANKHSSMDCAVPVPLMGVGLLVGRSLKAIHCWARPPAAAAQSAGGESAAASPSHSAATVAKATDLHDPEIYGIAEQQPSDRTAAMAPYSSYGGGPNASVDYMLDYVSRAEKITQMSEKRNSLRPVADDCARATLTVDSDGRSHACVQTELTTDKLQRAASVATASAPRGHNVLVGTDTTDYM